MTPCTRNNFQSCGVSSSRRVDTCTRSPGASLPRNGDDSLASFYNNDDDDKSCQISRAKTTTYLSRLSQFRQLIQFALVPLLRITQRRQHESTRVKIGASRRTSQPATQVTNQLCAQTRFCEIEQRRRSVNDYGTATRYALHKISVFSMYSCKRKDSPARRQRRASCRDCRR